MVFEIQTVEANAAPFIASELRHGRGLAQLLRNISIDRGEVKAAMPMVEHSLGESFEFGSLRSGDEERAAVEVLAKYLVETHGLTTTSNKVLFAEFADGGTSRPESVVDRRKAAQKPYSTLWIRGADRASDNNELWFVDNEARIEDVVAMLVDALWFPAIAALVQIPPGTKLVDYSTIEFDDLRSLASNPDAILVGAWDAMNYLIWESY